MSIYNSMLGIFGRTRNTAQTEEEAHDAVVTAVRNDLQQAQLTQRDAFQQMVDQQAGAIGATTGQAVITTQTGLGAAGQIHFHTGANIGEGTANANPNGHFTIQPAHMWDNTNNGFRPYTHTVRWEPPPRDPLQEGHDFLESLGYLNPEYITEIVVSEELYNKLTQIYNTDGPDRLKFFECGVEGGIFLIRNKKYLFDMDKYMEDVPKGKLP